MFDENTTEQELKDFQATLKILNKSNRRPLSKEAIIEVAKTLTKDKAEIHIGKRDYKNDADVAYELGCKTIGITRESFEEAVNNLKNKCLVILPFETSDGIYKLDWKKHPNEMLHYFGLADFFESRKSQNIDLFLEKKTEKMKGF